jgi:hypothetical protein
MPGRLHETGLLSDSKLNVCTRETLNLSIITNNDLPTLSVSSSCPHKLRKVANTCDSLSTVQRPCSATYNPALLSNFHLQNPGLTTSRIPSCLDTSKGRQPGGPPSATSTSAAQPSTPFTPSAPAGRKRLKPSPIPASSVPAGTPLRGLNYLKNHSEPLALEDSEYPAWLWKCLDGG